MPLNVFSWLAGAKFCAPTESESYFSDVGVLFALSVGAQNFAPVHAIYLFLIIFQDNEYFVLQLKTHRPQLNDDVKEYSF